MSSGIVICRLCAESKHNYKQVDLECDMIRRDEVIQHLARLNATIDFNDIRLPNTVCLDCICSLDKCSDFVDNVESSQKVLHDIFYQRTSTQIPLSDDAIFFERAGLDDCDFLTESESDYSNESQDAITPNTDEDTISQADSVLNHPDSSVCSDGPVVISTRSETQEVCSDEICLRDLLNNPDSSIAFEPTEPTANIETDYDNIIPAEVLRLNTLDSNNVSDEPIEPISSDNEAHSDAIISVKSLDNHPSDNECIQVTTNTKSDTVSPVKKLGLNDFDPYSSSDDEPITVTNNKKTDAVTPVKKLGLDGFDSNSSDDVSLEISTNTKTDAVTPVKKLGLNDLDPNSNSDNEPITVTTNEKTDAVTPVKKLGLNGFDPNSSSDDESRLIISSVAESKSNDKIPKKNLGLHNLDPNKSSDDESRLIISSVAESKSNDKIFKKDLRLNDLDPNSSSDDEPSLVISSIAESKSNDKVPKKDLRLNDLNHSSSSDDEPIKRSSTKTRANPLKRLRLIDSDTDCSDGSEQATPDTVKKKPPVHSIPLDELTETWESYNWLCNFCETIFPTVDELQSHSMEVHSSCNPYRCKRCKIRKQCLQPFVKHLRSHMHKLKLSCFKCPAIFEDMLTAQTHNEVHFKKLSCPGCYTTFKNNKELKTHQDIYFKLKYMKKNKNPLMKDDGLTCAICDKKCKTKNALRKHLPVHSRKRDYVCEICGKKYFEKNHLTYHMETHSDDRPFKCKICNLGFQRMNVLKEHVWVHNDKPFPCDKCNKTFKLRKHLKIHSAIHSDVLPYKCSICKKCFRIKCTLDRHFRTHTGEKPFSCPVCMEKFRNNSNLYNHTKKKHNLITAKAKKIHTAGTKDNIEWKKQMMKRKLPEIT